MLVIGSQHSGARVSINFAAGSAQPVSMLKKLSTPRMRTSFLDSSNWVLQTWLAPETDTTVMGMKSNPGSGVVVSRYASKPPDTRLLPGVPPAGGRGG